MRKEKESTVQLKESTVVVKPKGKCAEFAVKIAGPMVIDGDGKPRDAYKPALHAAYKGLQRFIEAQDKWNIYDKALEEVKNGKKETHWIWFIFPQLYGLGESEMSQFYGLDGTTDVTSDKGKDVYVSKADVTVTLGNHKVVLTVNVGLTVNVK